MFPDPIWSFPEFGPAKELPNSLNSQSALCRLVSSTFVQVDEIFQEVCSPRPAKALGQFGQAFPQNMGKLKRGTCNVLPPCC